MSSKRWGTSDGVQERVLDAAMTIFQTKGYAATTMTDIVSEAGISTGSIYHHFGGKDELFAACYLRLRSSIRDLVDIDPNEGVPPVGSWEKAYLWAIWTQRDQCSVFLGLDLPSTFDPVAKVAEYYRKSGHCLGENTSRLVAAVLMEAMRIVVECSAEEAPDVIDHVVTVIMCIQEGSNTTF